MKSDQPETPHTPIPPMIPRLLFGLLLVVQGQTVTLDRVYLQDTPECVRVTTALALSRLVHDAAEFFPDPNGITVETAIYRDMSPSVILRRQAEHEGRREEVGRQIRRVVGCTTQQK